MSSLAAVQRARTVAVVIPTLDAGDRFGDVLAGIEAQAGVARPELIVVDSGSADGTPRLAAELGARVLHIEPESFDHGLVRNLGAAQSDAELVVFLSQDAVPADADWLGRLVEAMAPGDVAGAYSRQLVRDGAHPFLAGRQRCLYGDGVPARRSRLETPGELLELDPESRLARIRFDNVSSCVRRSVLEAIPFRSLPFGEDLDWSKRALRAGHSIVYQPLSRVVHTHDLDLRAEFQRVYLDHQALANLVGLRAVPSFAAACAFGRREAKKLRRLARPSGRGAIAWHVECSLLGLSQNLAQWLGAASASGLRDGRRSARLVDGLVRFGVRGLRRSRRETGEAGRGPVVRSVPSIPHAGGEAA